MTDLLIILTFSLFISGSLLITALEARVGKIRAAEIVSKPTVRAYLVAAALAGLGLAGAVAYSLFSRPLRPFEWTSLIACAIMVCFAGMSLWLLWVASLSREKMESSKRVFSGQPALQMQERFLIGFVWALAYVPIVILTIQLFFFWDVANRLERSGEVGALQVLPFRSSGLATRHLLTDGLEVSIDSTGTVSTKWLTKGNPPLSGRDYFFALLWPLLSIVALWLWKRLTPRSEILGGLFGIIALLLAFGQIPFILFALFS